MAQEYVAVNENYGDPVACTYEELCDVLRMFQADDPTINGRHLVVAGDAVVELSHDDPDHYVVVAYTEEEIPLAPARPPFSETAPRRTRQGYQQRQYKRREY